ncbi:MAG: hypothetical protein M1820_008006 [Bogoriella megaspora]|nr:MAG: hypothetical protein M1820_008006 [Bogoriella megaspora]
MSFYSVFSRMEHATTAPYGAWRSLSLLVVATACALYLLRRWALPKPIPGIPYRRDGARHILGDLPALLKATATKNQTHMQWIQQQLQELNSPIIQIFLRPLSRPVIVVADFRETQDILMRRKEWDRSALLTELFGGLIPDHHSQHQTNAIWKARRRLLQDLMSPPFLHNVAAPAMYDSALNLISLWEEKARIAKNRPLSATVDIYKAALDAVQAFAYGKESNYSAVRPNLELLEGLDGDAINGLLSHGASKGDNEPVQFIDAKSHDVVDATLSLAEAVETVQGTPFMQLTWKLLKLTPHHRRAQKIKDSYLLGELKRAVDHMILSDGQGQDGVGDSTTRVRSAVDYMVQREKKLAEKDGREPEYFSSAMMTEIFGFVITGHDTSSTTILWGLKCLSDNQAPQMHLRSILQASFGAAHSEKRNPSVAEIVGTTIPYLDAVIEEILRCAGTIPCIDRQAMVDTQVLGHHIPKGTIMFILSQGPSVKSAALEIDESSRSQTCQAAKQDGRCRGEWDPEDIDLFKPERWLVSTNTMPTPEQIEKKDAHSAFNMEAGPQLAFSLGTRACYGRKLAYLELRILVTLIVWNFELLPCPNQLSGYGSKIGITNKPRQCFVRLRKVTQSGFD